MSKKQNESNSPKTVKLVKGSIVETISANLNKHGVIKGANKKETKKLKTICVHHAKNKKGKVRPRLVGEGDHKKRCTLCDQVIETNIYEDQEVRKRVGQMQSILTQTAYMVEASGFGKETALYIANLQNALGDFPKTYKKIAHVVRKNDETKRKKKKGGKGNRGNVTESLGSWM